MGEEERGFGEEKNGTDCSGGGFSIFLDEAEMVSFMEGGDFSSSRDIDHFRKVESGIEKRLKEGGGYSLMALSVGEKRISRDFTVLQLAHLLAKHGRKVLIVDCDFMEPGLSGLVEHVEDQGFLDLLLYGSSLKSVMRPVGIDGVSVTGAGSFPVSRTIPFALKEFSKVNEFLSASRDVVIYCSTLYDEGRAVNPLPALVDGLVLCCRIDEMEEGQLQKTLQDLGSDVPPADLICFCKAKEPAGVAEAGDEEEILDLEPESEIRDDIGDLDESVTPDVIEKSEEIDTIRKPAKKRSLNIPRLAVVVAATLVVVFIVWWVLISRSDKQNEASSEMTELIQKQMEARDLAEKSDVDSVKAQTPVVTEDVPVTEQDDGAVVTQEPVEEDDVPEETVEQERQVTLAPEGMFYCVHVASFKDMQRAGTETDYFEGKDFEVRVNEVEVRGQAWYRVYVGEYESMEEAEKVRQELLSLRRIAYARVVTLKYE